MSLTLLVVQSLNGLQLGVLLFLMSAGLTLIFGIMNFLNLAHGILYTAGAYIAITIGGYAGSYAVGIALAVIVCFAIGVLLEVLLFRFFYNQSHLDQVLATLGLMFAAEELIRSTWGPNSFPLSLGGAFATSIRLAPGISYPVYRIVIIAAGVAIGGILYFLVQHTRIGMLVRAGATDRQMVAAHGVNVDRIFTFLFGLGAALAGIAGMIAAPIVSVQPNMGDNVLILSFVVIVVGGIGSISGAVVGSLLVGLIDTLGRSLIVFGIQQTFPADMVTAVSSAVSSMLIYVLMAVVLLLAPAGLLPAQRGRDG
jgi:branched-chain amino acid transport system permease protein